MQRFPTSLEYLFKLHLPPSTFACQCDVHGIFKIGPKGLSYCVYWLAVAAAAGAGAAAIVSPVNKIACSLVVRSRPCRSTTKVLCL